MDLAALARAVEVLMSPLEWGSRDAWLDESLRRVRDVCGAASPDAPGRCTSASSRRCCTSPATSRGGCMRRSSPRCGAPGQALAGDRRTSPRPSSPWCPCGAPSRAGLAALHQLRSSRARSARRSTTWRPAWRSSGMAGSARWRGTRAWRSCWRRSPSAIGSGAHRAPGRPGRGIDGRPAGGRFGAGAGRRVVPAGGESGGSRDAAARRRRGHPGGPSEPGTSRPRRSCGSPSDSGGASPRSRCWRRKDSPTRPSPSGCD